MSARLTIGSVQSGATGRADLWISECGSQGVQVDRRDAAPGRTIDFSSQMVGVPRGPERAYCTEVFLVGCQLNGSPVSCSQAFPLNAVRLDVQYR